MEQSVVRASTFVDVVAERAALSSGAAFQFITPGNPERPALTFPELHDRARAIGALLAGRVAPGDRVLVLLPPGLDYVASFLGCLYAGAIAVPLYPPSKGSYSARHRAVLADSSPAAALVPGAVLADPAELVEAAGIPGLPLIAVDGELPAPDDWRRPEIDGDNVAFLQYTSGSTATPRGVVVTHRNLVVNSRQIQERFRTTPDTGVVSWLPPYHDMGLIGGILQPVYAGATATLFSPVSFITRPMEWLRLISEQRARISGGPNFAYDLCVDRIPEADLEGLDLSHWEVAFNGAEPVRARTLERFAERMAPHGFRRGSFFPCYGLAEGTLMVSGRTVGDTPVAESFDADSLAPGQLPVHDDDGLRVVGCGPVAEDLTVTIVDPEAGTACPPGTVGEIWASGDNIAAGYWGRTDPDKETFGAGLADDDRSYLRTGDLGFLRDGQLYVTGRSKDLIVVRGRNHYPQDLEQAALDAHATLRRGAAAFALDSDGREEVCLVLETAVGHRREEIVEVTGEVRTRLAREHGVTPGTVVFVRPGHIPRTTSGKIQRSRTRAMLVDDSLKVVHRWDAGRTGTPGRVNALAPLPEHLWQETARETVLALAGRRLNTVIDPALPLVAQGLDSLAAIELKAAVEDAIGMDLSLEALLAGASVDELLASAGQPAADALSLGSSAERDGGPSPLAFNQQALWILERQHPDSAAQHIYVALKLLTDVDVEALRRAFQTLVDRHPALRTALHWGENGDPYQEVLDHQDVAFAVEDAAHLDDGQLGERLRHEVRGELFSLSEGRVLQVVLFRRPGGDVLSIVVHHIAVDMWSIAIMTDELGRLYARETGRDAVLPAPPAAGYSELAHRQRALLDSPRGRVLWDYWRTELDGCKPVLELPADHPRPPTLTYRGDTVTLEVDAGTTAALRDHAASEGTTLFVALLSVFQSLVQCYTGEDDFLVGVPASGRTDADLQGVVGYFVNPVLIRSRMDDARSFTEQLRETKKSVVGAMQHQEMPFPVLVERLSLAREASRPPGYQLMFSLTKSHLLGGEDLPALNFGRAGARLKLRELEAESLDLVRRTAQIDMTMVVTEVGDHLEAAINFSTDLFDRETVERFGENFSDLASRLVKQPSLPLAEIPSAREAELQRIAEWNATSTEYPRTRTVTELFAEHVAARPDAPALTYGELSYTYRELDRVSNALAHRLRALGVAAETPVALYVDRDPAVVVAMLAVAKAGGAYIPLDPAHPPRRLRQILNESGAALVLTRPGGSLNELIGDDEGAAAELPTLTPCDFMTAVLASDPAHDRPVPAAHTGDNASDGLLYVMYTSGSSGTPKGICITHRNVVRLVQDADYLSLGPGDRVAQISNAAFDAATLEIWGALLNGGQLVGFGKDTVLSPPQLATALRDNEIHTVVMATPLFTQVVGYDPATFANARQLLVGGDSMDPKRAREVAALGGPLLTNGYGPTESTTFATTQQLHEVPEEVWRLPIGGPVSNTSVYVLDERLHPVPVGVPGQLYIGGDGLGRGYLGRPALTAEKFLPDPFSAEPGARMYASGDLARWLPDGTIDFLGRVDFQAKVRGFRIEPGDIDAALTAHPGVLEAVTVVDGSTGEKRLVAYYAGTPTVAELTEHLAERLPEYMVPSVLVPLPELPKNPNRKIDRSALRLPEPGAAVASATPDVAVADEAGAQAPGIHEEVAAMLAEVLGRPDVGLDDNFFEIGGHSLLAIRLLAQIKQRYEVDLALNELFNDPTARAVAEQIAQQTDDETRAEAIAPSVPAGPTAVSRSAYVRKDGSR
ncbi:non-ribosomal peptide synthetase [Streptomyces atratus]|uniref:Amino acid adenylation domain-containing protein n=1 Tax=Streptomyces atratus TaxID=1893 RepID=A0A1K2B3C2_STRAR|nr:non-ribosomal peptide synthetase [Streptomyces atratus]SFX93194.1 amino acid adenylation domain-containing protein [Streptomyces atratus]